LIAELKKSVIVFQMSELIAAEQPIVEVIPKDTFQRRLMRIRRTASLIGLVGTRQGIPLLAERLLNPNADEPHTINIRELKHPLHLTAAHSDIAMLNEIVGMGIYDLPGFDDSIDGNLIIDLGANIGVSASLFATRYPHSQIIAVEAHPRNASFLRQNAADYQGGIVPLNKAIGLEAGWIGLANPDAAEIGHHAVYEFRSGQNGGGTDAEVLLPEELIDLAGQRMPGQQRIGLLKINIEGEEKALLASRRMDPLLDKTNVVIIEAHDRKIDGTSEVVLAAAVRNGLKQFDKRGSFFFFQAAN
jgi:FkbM family methyltransferase